MKIRILPSTPDADLQYLTSFLIEDAVAIDAGCIGYQPLSGGDGVDHVFLTHSHLDHVGSLPIYLESRERPLTLYGHPFTVNALGMHFFNDRIWPNIFRRDPDVQDKLRIEYLESGRPVEVGDLRIIPVEVSHTVPTLGMIVEGPRGAVAFGADSGPTDHLWKVAAATGCLKAVFIECSFPDRLSEFAQTSGHLTPRLVRSEAAKLPTDTRLIPVHIKPRYRAEVVEELLALELPHLEIGKAGKDYVF